MASGEVRSGVARRDVVPAILAEFGSPERLLEAAARLRAAGYERIELYSPYPLEGAEALLGLPRPRLPWFVLACGLAGAAAALWIQWFANAWDYPLNVGGRPLLSLPAWVPVTFEIGVLSAALGAFVGLLARAGLPRLWHPVFTAPGFEDASVDGFWLAVGVGDARYEPARTRRELEALGPRRIAMPEAAG